MMKYIVKFYSISTDTPLLIHHLKLALQSTHTSLIVAYKISSQLLQNIMSSGTLEDYTIISVDDLFIYESCKNCETTISFHETFDLESPHCPNCKSLLLEEPLDFKFTLFLEKEGRLDQVQGFRKDLIEFGPHDLDEILENPTLMDLEFDLDARLEDFFVGKKITIEYSKRKKEKLIHKIKQVTKTEPVEVEEPPKKKVKTEDI